MRFWKKKPQKKDNKTEVFQNEGLSFDDSYEDDTTSAEQNDVKQEEKQERKILKSPEEISSKLDDLQLKAVEAPIGNTCVFAIAGSGKTRVLTYRVANMIANNIPESEIMLLTFTNKAADEMSDRIKAVLKKKRLDLLSGTFHSIAGKILRDYAGEIGYDKKFKIITPGTQRTMIDGLREEYLAKYMEGFNNDEFPSKAVIADIYSGAINHNLSFREYITQYYSYLKNHIPDGIILILKDYVEKKEKENLMDFDDLLLNFMDILSMDHIREQINKEFKYIFVDEYQDINWMQYQILEYLNGNNSLFVIGDSKQCIYQFRGSRPEYIDVFKKTHENVSSYSLTYNYRSTPEILHMAEEVIFKNDPENPLIMNTKNPKSCLPLIFGHDDDEKEAMKIAEIIKEKQYDYSQTAVLVRRGAQVAMVEKAFKKERIPYNIVGSTSMYESEHIQDLLAFLQLIDDKSNIAAFKRIAMLFRGIGQNFAQTMYERLENAGFDYFMAEKMSSSQQQRAFSVMKGIIYADFRVKKNDENNASQVSTMLQCIINTFYGNYAKNRFSDYTDRMEDIRYFYTQAKGYDNLSDFIDDSMMMRNSERKKDSCATIITMHKAKGLEWDYVFIPFVDKDEWPRCRAKEYLYNGENIKNERNLFYVAVTRARKMLYISYSLSYTLKPAGPSPFLEEIDGDAYDVDFFGKTEREEQEEE